MSDLNKLKTTSDDLQEELKVNNETAKQNQRDYLHAFYSGIIQELKLNSKSLEQIKSMI